MSGRDYCFPHRCSPPLGTHCVLAIEQQQQQPFELFSPFEQEHAVSSVIMQSVILPCKAILLVMEPETVGNDTGEEEESRPMKTSFVFSLRSCGIK